MENETSNNDTAGNGIKPIVTSSAVKSRRNILITEKQKQQFNIMLVALRKISKHYQTPSQLRKDSEKQYGLYFEEAIEMAYENIQSEAAFACKNIKPM